MATETLAWTETPPTEAGEWWWTWMPPYGHDPGGKRIGFTLDWGDGRLGIQIGSTLTSVQRGVPPGTRWAGPLIPPQEPPK